MRLAARLIALPISAPEVPLRIRVQVVVVIIASLLTGALLAQRRPPAGQSRNPPYAAGYGLPEPRLFGEGIISTGDTELNAAFTPDGTTLYFSKRTPRLQFWAIVVSSFQQGAWRTPEVATFSGQHNDVDPFVSPDGSKLLFISSRSGQTRGDYDIWIVDRLPSGWGTPRHVPAPVNTESQEYYPTVSLDGTLYFSSTRAGGSGRGDLYRSKLIDGRYEEPENLGPTVNSEFFDGDPFIAPDQSYLIFASYGRPDGLGDGDLYISYQRNGGWTKPVNLGSTINSSALEFCPIVSPDGRYLFFTSERGFADQPQPRRLNYSQLVRQIRSPRNGLGDIYQIDISRLPGPP